VIPDQYWERNREAHEFTQGVRLHHERVNAIEFIINEMKKGITLDIGCGKRCLGTVANIDIAYPSIRDPTFQIMDAHNLDFPDNSFEAISIIEVIEHVENPSQVLREIYRVLMIDGKMFLTTPNPAHISVFIKRLRNKRIKIHCDHLHTWHWEMLTWLIHNVGFRDIHVFFWGSVEQILKDGKPAKLYRSYRLANILYRLGFRSPMLNLNMFIICRK